MKTTILCHADADGMCAGAIALARFPRSQVFFTKPVSLLADLKDVKADNIIIADIALNKRDAPEIVRMMGEKKANIIYFDHHPIPPNITLKDLQRVCKCVREPGDSASEITYRYYQKEIPSERIWLAMYGAIADYAETPFIEERLRNWDKRAIYFEVSTLVLGIKVKEFTTYDAKREILNVLARGGNPSDVFGLVSAARTAVGMEFDLYKLVKRRAQAFGDIGYVERVPAFGFRGPSAVFAATVMDKPVGLCVYITPRHIDITARMRQPGYILNELMEHAADAVGGSGGGLPEAAGARIPTGSLQKFLQAMDDLMKKQKAVPAGRKA
jgi:RecJ-like exonuclease